MKKHLTFKDDKSDKFWSIEVNGKSFTVAYGKTGTAGQTSTKDFDTEEMCMREAKKLVGEKMKKGYGESNRQSIEGSNSENFYKDWESLINAKDLNQALINHFSYLADSPGFEKVLDALMQTATEVKIDNIHLIVRFGKNSFLSVNAPGKISSYKKFPSSFLSIIEKGKVHKFIYNFNEMELSGDNYFDFGIYDEGENVYELFDGKESKVLNPLHHQDMAEWLYNPKEKNPQGEPLIFPVIHELEDVIEPVYMNIGSLFLREISKVLGVDVAIPNIEPLENDSQKRDLGWWNDLDKNWKEVFPEGVPKGIENIDLDNKNISDLSPLNYLIDNKLIKLEKISLRDTSVTDISILSKAKKLFSVNISGTSVTDVSSLKQISFLEADRCANLDFASILLLKKNLRRLSIRDTKFSDINALFPLKLLNQLNVLCTNIPDKELKKFIILFRKDSGYSIKDYEYLKVDVHPEIADPLLRTLADYKDYNPKLALEAGEKLLSENGKRNDIDKILKQMISICAKNGNGKNEELATFYYDYEARLEYILKSKDFFMLKSVKEIRDLKRETISIIKHIYQNPFFYESFLTYRWLEGNSFHYINGLYQAILKTRFFDITEENVAEAVLEADFLECKIQDDNQVVVRLKAN